MKIEVNNFTGAYPKLASHLLQDNQAQLAENARVEKSDVRGWRKVELSAAITDNTWAALHQYQSSLGDNWCYFTTDTDFAENPIAGDTFERLYFTKGGVMYAFANDLDSSPWDMDTDSYKVGPAKPVDTGTWGFVSGHNGGSQYRAYVYTYVTRYGEETGPIATILETEVYDGASNVVIEDFTQPPAGYGLRTTVGSNAPKVRIYRTNSSVSGAEYQYVGEFNATTHTFGTDTFTDNVADADLGEVLPTELYEGFPSTGAGLISLTNGVFACFVGNELYLSEPYQPHAWPDEYVLSFDYDIVALGYLGTNIVVLTEGVPYMVIGPSPEAMTKQRINGFYPCISKRSTVSTPFGVAYASYEGLILVNHNGAANVTFSHITPEEWADYYPSTVHGQFYNGQYFGFYNSTNTGTFILDVQNQLFTTLREYYLASYLEVAEGKMYLIRSESTDSIVEWEGDQYNYMYYKWKSKRWLLPKDTGFTCAQVMVDLDWYNTVLAQIEANNYLASQNNTLWSAGGPFQDQVNDGKKTTGSAATDYDWLFNAQHFNYSALFDASQVEINQYINFKLYVDNELVFTKNVNSDKFFRLPAVRGRRVEFQIEGYLPVRRVVLAQSPRELG